MTEKQLLISLREAWPKALSCWGSYLRLQEPIICLSKKEEEREGLSDSFAMIRLTDHRVFISARSLREHKLEDYGMEILAHEIGHHIYCPGDLGDNARMLARARRALPGVEDYAPMVCNLYADMLINDRLKRGESLRMQEIYAALSGNDSTELWDFYMRAYEILWGLERGSLARGPLSDELEGDALLAADIARSFSRDWLRGSGRFAALCLPYLLGQSATESAGLKAILDALKPGSGSDIPSGIGEMDEDEAEGSIHPALDKPQPQTEKKIPEKAKKAKQSEGNFREPFEYGQLLKAMGLDIAEAEIFARYYKERALPHLIPFPAREMPQSMDPINEGLEIWEPGSPLERIDWFQSLARNPVIIPGLTTLQNVEGLQPGFEKAKEPLDLDLYLDCSGSMPDPRQSTSYLALAGAILVLSALRAGSRVQATLWSGAGEYTTSAGFTRDQSALMAILTGYFGGGTAFPIHILRDTYATRPAKSRLVHILCLSDEGIDTMFSKDERGKDGESVAVMALAKAGGGGSLALNLSSASALNSGPLKRAAEIGFHVTRLSDWEGLVSFAREFSLSHFSPKEKA